MICHIVIEQGRRVPRRPDAGDGPAAPRPQGGYNNNTNNNNNNNNVNNNNNNDNDSSYANSSYNIK